MLSNIYQISTYGKFWEWTNETLIPGLYNNEWYNGENVHWRQEYFMMDAVLFRVGSPRFRLAKVKKGMQSKKLQQKFK